MFIMVLHSIILCHSFIHSFIHSLNDSFVLLFLTLQPLNMQSSQQTKESCLVHEQSVSSITTTSKACSVQSDGFVFFPFLWIEEQILNIAKNFFCHLLSSEMWKRFDFFTSTLLHSDLPTSSLYTVQVYCQYIHPDIPRHWISPP